MHVWLCTHVVVYVSFVEKLSSFFETGSVIDVVLTGLARLTCQSTTLTTVALTAQDCHYRPMPLLPAFISHGFQGSNSGPLTYRTSADHQIL